MKENKKSALILGATGLVGSQLLKQLCADENYDRLVMLVRREMPTPDPKVEVKVVDFDFLGEYADAFAVDEIFCCLGTTIKKAGSQEQFKKVDYAYPLAAAFLAKKEGARHYLLISALGANAKSSLFYNQVKGEVEEAIEAVGMETFSIFQPSLLLGDREEKRFGEKMGIIFYKLTQWMWVGPLRKYRGIYDWQVAKAMRLVAREKRKGVRRISNLEMLEMVEN